VNHVVQRPQGHPRPRRGAVGGHTTATTEPAAPVPVSAPAAASTRMRPPPRPIIEDKCGLQGDAPASRGVLPNLIERPELVEVDRLAVAEDEQHDGEPETDLRGGDRDDEEGEDLAAGQPVMEVGVEGDEVEVDRVEHELDGHEDEDRVAAREHAVDTEEKSTAATNSGKANLMSGRLPPPSRFPS